MGFGWLDAAPNVIESLNRGIHYIAEGVEYDKQIEEGRLANQDVYNSAKFMADSVVGDRELTEAIAGTLGVDPTDVKSVHSEIMSYFRQPGDKEDPKVYNNDFVNRWNNFTQSVGQNAGITPEQFVAVAMNKSQGGMSPSARQFLEQKKQRHALAAQSRGLAGVKNKAELDKLGQQLGFDARGSDIGKQIIKDENTAEALKLIDEYGESINAGSVTEVRNYLAEQGVDADVVDRMFEVNKEILDAQKELAAIANIESQIERRKAQDAHDKKYRPLQLKKIKADIEKAKQGLSDGPSKNEIHTLKSAQTYIEKLKAAISKAEGDKDQKESVKNLRRALTGWEKELQNAIKEKRDYILVGDLQATMEDPETRFSNLSSLKLDDNIEDDEIEELLSPEQQFVDWHGGKGSRLAKIIDTAEQIEYLVDIDTGRVRAKNNLTSQEEPTTDDTQFKSQWAERFGTPMDGDTAVSDTVASDTVVSDTTAPGIDTSLFNPKGIEGL